MKNYLLFLLLGFGLLYGQYTTPGEGTVFTLNDLILTEPSVVELSGTGEYILTSDLTISATDTLLIEGSIVLKINPDILITVFGNLTTGSGLPDPVLITSNDPAQPYNGFRFEEGSQIRLNKTVFEYGGGFRVNTGHFEMSHCTVRYMSEGQGNLGAVSFSTGNPIITFTHFFKNCLLYTSDAADE